MAENVDFPEFEYNAQYNVIHNEPNIKRCFDYYQENPYGLMDIREARFIVSLRAFYRKRGYLTEKQFKYLHLGIRRHEYISIEATAFHDECGDR